MKTNRALVFAVVIIAAVLACSLPVGSGWETPPPADTKAFTATEEATRVPSVTATSAPPATATQAPTQTSLPTATMNIVMITASGGSLNIRRGPGVPYNPIAILTEGQTATVIARNADGSWLHIEIPDGSGQGWVNATTQFSVSTGTINLLPVATVDLPVPAYIRNCTLHEMRIKPTGVIVPSHTNPSDKLQFDPGYYDIVDISTGKTVLSIDLREGNTIDITKDGLGNMYTCP